MKRQPQPFSRILVLLLLTALIATATTHASAFQTAPHHHQHHQLLPNTAVSNSRNKLVSSSTTTLPSISCSRRRIMKQQTPVLRLRGGAADDPAAKNKKIRIAAFDSMRFFLILNIVLGHFGRFADFPAKVLTAFSQHNVIVGAFFALSGYVTAYTTTELGQRAASPKLLDTPKQKWILQRIFGYFPLHLAVLILFSPLFVYADAYYNGPIVTAWHAILSVTMTQAWMPQHAEIWNAPTWFLSALSFATATLPYCLPAIASLGKTGLVKTGFWIWLVYFLPKLGYCYDFNTWQTPEGIVAPKAHPNYAAFNAQRFSPVFAVAEVLLGVIACRIVMLDSDSSEKEHPRRATTALSTAVPLAAMVGLVAARAYGVLEVSDLLFRSVAFVPLFLRFLMAAHRNTVAGKVTFKGDPILAFLNNSVLVALGGLAFPIFIVHGPVGQVFYKKLIAKKIFGAVLTGPVNFAAYLGSVLATAWVLQKTVLQNNAIKTWSKNSVDKLSESF